MRIIGHLDMDAFFAAIEERNNPRFAGMPIVVGADPRGGAGRGVVSTANYAARKYGIHSAQPINKAWHLAQDATRQGHPEAIFLSGSFSTYSTVSRRIMDILAHHTPNLQKRSVDEAYFDLSHTGSFENAAELARTIKYDIQKHEHLTASIGIGPNKLIAKVASDFDKPDGLTIVPAGKTEGFLEPLPIRAIPGIGPKAAEKLRCLGITTIIEMKQLKQTRLHQLFGVWGDAMYEKIRGRDSSPLRESTVAKSVGHNHTFFNDTLNASFLIPQLIAACQEVYERLTNDGFTTFRTITITTRFHDFQTQTRSKTLPEPTASLADLKHTATRLFLPFLDSRENPQRKPLRLIGVRVEKIA